MGNKYSSFLIFAIFLIGSGVVYQKFYQPPGLAGVSCPPENTVEMDVRSIKDEWRFEPANIDIKLGYNLKLHIYNEDTYDHGFAVEAFGVNNRLLPHQVTTIEFCASRVGEYPFYCSVACGEGHYQQTGKVIVRE